MNTFLKLILNIAFAVGLSFNAHAQNNSSFPSGGGGGGTPGGTTLQAQYNNAGAFAGLNILFLDANSIEQRNSTNRQSYYFYNTYTDASNYERVLVGWPGYDPNSFHIDGAHAGTGAARNMSIISEGSLALGSGGGVTFTVSNLLGFYAATDNAVDIGLAGSGRPRDFNVARHVVAGNGQTIPTATTCGTSPSVLAGSTDMGGNFTTGTGTPTACTITFNVAWPNFAFCTLTPTNAAAATNHATTFISAQSKTSFTITTAAVNSLSLNYSCNGN